MHHTYTNGRATDVSGAHNHGLPVATIAAGGAPGEDASVLRFEDLAAEVRVPRSESLARLDAIRLRVRFLWRPGAERGDERHNLVEGDRSFALFVTPHGGLRGTIVDATGTWRGPSAPQGTVSIAEWHVAELRHDGFSTLEVLLDGALVAAAHDVRGPVRGVGPKGIAIGHAIEPDSRHSFGGLLDDVALVKREITPDDVLDPCCADTGRLDELLTTMREGGFTERQARTVLGQLTALDAEIRTAAVAGNGARSLRLRELSVLGGAAVASGDLDAIAAEVARTAAFVRERVPEATLTAFAQRALTLLGDVPYGDLLTRVAAGEQGALDEAGSLLSAFCLPRPPAGPARPERKPAITRDGDPDTDHGPPGLVDGLDHTLDPAPEPEPAPERDKPGRGRPGEHPRPFPIRRKEK
jgi:hypothetical protein